METSAGMIALPEILLAVITFLLILQFKKMKRVAKRLPPGPPPLPIIGNLWTLKFSVHYETLMQLAKTYGKTFTLWAGPTPMVVVNGYEAVREALVYNSYATSGRAETNLLKRFSCGKGIAGSNHQIWKHQRSFGGLTLRKLGFAKNSLESQIQEEAQNLLEFFDSLKGKSVDPRFIVGVSTTNVLSSVALGHRFALDDDTFHKLITAATVVTHFMGSKWGQVSEMAPWLMRFIPGPHHTFFMNVDFIQNYAMQEIRCHKENPSNEPLDFIDFYLQQISKTSGDHTSTFNEDNLKHVLTDFIVAGAETVTLTLLWALLFMVAYPDIQEKVQKELHAVLGSSKVIDYEDRKRLPYTNATIHEVQRCTTIVPTALPHWCIKDTIIQGFPIAKGTILIANLASVNSDPEYWETPQMFTPNHFLDKEGNFVMKEAFMTFSAGPRVCLGERIARTEIFILFANLLRRFTFRLPSEEKGVNLEPICGTTLQPWPYRICALPNQHTAIS